MAGTNYHQKPTPVESFKFDKELDQKVQSKFEPLFDADGNRVVMPGAFNARRDAQITAREKKGR